MFLWCCRLQRKWAVHVKAFYKATLIVSLNGMNQQERRGWIQLNIYVHIPRAKILCVLADRREAAWSAREENSTLPLIASRCLTKKMRCWQPNQPHNAEFNFTHTLLFPRTANTMAWDKDRAASAFSADNELGEVLITVQVRALLFVRRASGKKIAEHVCLYCKSSLPQSDWITECVTRNPRDCWS